VALEKFIYFLLRDNGGPGPPRPPVQELGLAAEDAGADAKVFFHDSPLLRLLAFHRSFICFMDPVVAWELLA